MGIWIFFYRAAGKNLDFKTSNFRANLKLILHFKLSFLGLGLDPILNSLYSIKIKIC